MAQALPEVRPRRVVDAVVDMLIAEAGGLEPGFALRRAYEDWARQSFSPSSGTRESPTGETLRSRARTSGRVLALLEHEEHFPSAAHRLSGRLKVTRAQACYFFLKIFELWNYEPGGDAGNYAIDTDDDYVRGRVEALLDKIFLVGGVESQDVLVPVHRAPESTLEKWTADSFRDAECVMVIGAESPVIVGESEVTAIDRFVNSSMPSVLENLKDGALWIWLVDLGLESGRDAPDWHKYSNVVRLYACLAAYVHRLGKTDGETGDRLLDQLTSNCFVGIRGTPNASRSVMEHLRSGHFESIDVHVNVERLFNPAISERDKSELAYGRLVIGVKGTNTSDCVMYLPRFATPKVGNSLQPSSPALGVAYGRVQPDEDFVRAFDLVHAAAGKVRARLPGGTHDVSSEEVVLLTRGIRLFSVSQFVQSEWLSPFLHK